MFVERYVNSIPLWEWMCVTSYGASLMHASTSAACFLPARVFSREQKTARAFQLWLAKNT